MKVFSFQNNQEFLALPCVDEIDRRIAMHLRAKKIQKEIAYEMQVSLRFIREKCRFLEKTERIFLEIKKIIQEKS